MVFICISVVFVAALTGTPDWYCSKKAASAGLGVGTLGVYGVVTGSQVPWKPKEPAFPFLVTRWHQHMGLGHGHLQAIPKCVSQWATRYQGRTPLEISPKLVLPRPNTDQHWEFYLHTPHLQLTSCKPPNTAEGSQ